MNCGQLETGNVRPPLVEGHVSDPREELGGHQPDRGSQAVTVHMLRRNLIQIELEGKP